MHTDKIKRFARYGLVGGLALGLFSGFVVSGPHIHSWSPSLSFSVIVGSAVLGAFIGYAALAIIVGSLARGGTPSSFASGGSDGSSQDLNVVAHDSNAHFHHNNPHSHGETSHGSHD